MKLYQITIWKAATIFEREYLIKASQRATAATRALKRFAAEVKYDALKDKIGSSITINIERIPLPDPEKASMGRVWETEEKGDEEFAAKGFSETQDTEEEDDQNGEG